MLPSLGTRIQVDAPSPRRTFIATFSCGLPSSSCCGCTSGCGNGVEPAPGNMNDPTVVSEQHLLLDMVAARPGHFALESGYHAETWLELDQLFTRPAELQPFVSLLANKISVHRVDVVCGPMTGGAFLAEMIATQLGVDFCWAERIRTERIGRFAVDYRIPAAIRGNIAGRRVAIVDDAISAGSAVRGTLADLDAIGARTVVLGAMLVLGPAADDLASHRGIPLERVVDLPFRTWPPVECPLCASATPLEQLA